jgi:hypothetical protein
VAAVEGGFADDAFAIDYRLAAEMAIELVTRST